MAVVYPVAWGGEGSRGRQFQGSSSSIRLIGWPWAVEDVPKMGFGIELVELGRAEEPVDGGCALAAFVAAGEGPVAAGAGDAAQRVLGDVVVDLEVAIVEEAGQGTRRLSA